MIFVWFWRPAFAFLLGDWWSYLLSIEMVFFSNNSFSSDFEDHHLPFPDRSRVLFSLPRRVQVISATWEPPAPLKNPLFRQVGYEKGWNLWGWMMHDSWKRFQQSLFSPTIPVCSILILIKTRLRSAEGWHVHESPTEPLRTHSVVDMHIYQHI